MRPVDDHEVHRFEDEGGNTIPFRVGVPAADEPVVLKDQRPEKARHRDRNLRLVDPTPTPPLPSIWVQGHLDAPDEAPKVLDARGEEVSSLTWPSFLAWRKTKCRPFDYENDPRMATCPLPAGVPAHETTLRALEEIDQATHELVGEVAELGQLFMEGGPSVFFGDKRRQLLDECGDIFFCASWALDAWGLNPLYQADDLEMIRVADDSELAVFAKVIAGNKEEDVLRTPQFLSMLGGLVFNLMLTAQTNAGLLCNAFKKLRYHRREQDVEAQVARIASVLIAVNQILVVANSSAEEALQVNQRKLDARYPDGYKPGQGGGIREGAGK